MMAQRTDGIRRPWTTCLSLRIRSSAIGGSWLSSNRIPRGSAGLFPSCLPAWPVPQLVTQTQDGPQVRALLPPRLSAPPDDSKRARHLDPEALRSQPGVQKEQLAPGPLDPHDRRNGGPRGHRVQDRRDRHPFDRAAQAEPAGRESTPALNLRYSALMAVERADDLPVPVSWGFAAAGPAGARTLLVRGDPQGAGMRRDGCGAAVPCWFMSEERPGPGRLRVTTRLNPLDWSAPRHAA
jgi:hypothetical protein